MLRGAALYLGVVFAALASWREWRRRQREKYEALGDGDVWSEGDRWDR